MCQPPLKRDDGGRGGGGEAGVEVEVEAEVATPAGTVRSAGRPPPESGLTLAAPRFLRHERADEPPAPMVVAASVILHLCTAMDTQCLALESMMSLRMKN